MPDWSQIQSFAAVAEHGSLSAAARTLGSSQPTLSRHIAQLEAEMGARLFERSRGGMALTAQGAELMHHAQAMADAAARFEPTSTSPGLSGTVRITASRVVAHFTLPPIIAQIRLTHPEIEIELVASDSTDNLLRREADIALRIGEPTQPDLIARKLVKIGFGWYASRDWLKRHGPIKSEQEVMHKDIVGFASESQPPGILPLVESPPDSALHFSVTSNSMAARMFAIRAGYGVGVASHRWATMYPELVNVFPGRNVGSADLWIVTHEELRHSARIRAVFDYLSERVQQSRSQFKPPNKT